MPLPRSVGARPQHVAAPDVQLGLRANWFQFSLLAVLTLLIGMTVGVERVALPPLAQQGFHVTSYLYTVAFIAAFGLVKAAMNLTAGRWADRVGRKKVLLAGWLVGLPFPFLIIFAPSWPWIVAANFLVGLNQALAWTMTVTAKIDLVGPRNRGLAVGINECSGYAGVAFGGYAGGILATDYGLRPAPYLLALAVLLLGLFLSVWPMRETLPWAQAEAGRRDGPDTPTVRQRVPTLAQIVRYVSWQDRTLFAVAQAGFIEKFADTLVWGFFPLYFLSLRRSPAEVGLLTGVYALTWGVLQIPSGALADRVGRKLPITAGMLLVAGGIALLLLVHGLLPWLLSALVMGAGMALHYPNLIAAVGDVAHPVWRGSALGVYRLWRDAGYAVGAITIGLVADAFGLRAGFWFTAAMLVVSGGVVALVMEETETRLRTAALAWERHPEWVEG